MCCVTGGMVWGLILALIFAGAAGSWTLLARASELSSNADESAGTGPAGSDAEWLRGIGYAVLAVTCVFG